MAEFGVAAQLDVRVNEQSVQAARAKIEDGLDVTVTPEADTTSGGGPSSGLPMTDGGATVGEQLAEQTDLLEDIEDHVASGGGGGNTLLAGSAGLLASVGAIAARGGAGTAPFGFATTQNVYGEGEEPPGIFGEGGSIMDVLGRDEPIFDAPAAAAEFSDDLQDLDLGLSTEGLTEATADAGETMAGTWAAAVDSRVDSIFDGSVGERIGANMMMALDPTGLGETLGRTAQSELSSMFDGILGSGEANRPTDAQTIMDNNEGALMPSDRGLAEAAAKENRARQQRQDRQQMDVDVGPIDFDLSGLDEIDDRLDKIADEVKSKIEQEVFGA